MERKTDNNAFSLTRPNGLAHNISFAEFHTPAEHSKIHLENKRRCKKCVGYLD